MRAFAHAALQQYASEAASGVSARPLAALRKAAASAVKWKLAARLLAANVLELR